MKFYDIIFYTLFRVTQCSPLVTVLPVCVVQRSDDMTPPTTRKSRTFHGRISLHSFSGDNIAAIERRICAVIHCVIRRVKTLQVRSDDPGRRGAGINSSSLIRRCLPCYCCWLIKLRITSDIITFAFADATVAASAILGLYCAPTKTTWIKTLH